ncbi:MAG TPA: hypothetical protein PK854_06075 [Oscillospiraceae bacterium]|nr:hypothetical protein [Oscillospiraceae bacterium]HPS34813.1 hypothetical protein [Oscillospiraceae bacterium]
MKRELSVLRASMKRIRTQEILLVSIFMLIGIGCIFFGDYAVRSYEFEQASRGYYSENAFGMQARSSTKADIDVTELLKKYINEHKDVVIYRYTKASLSSVGLIFSGYSYLPPILEGRFFEASDFFSGKALCVVGKDFTPNSAETIETENGKEYLVSGGIRYEIIGKMGYEIKSPANRSSIMNLDAQAIILPYYHSDSFVVDTADKKAAEASRTELKQFLAEVGAAVTISEIPKSEMSVSEFFNMSFLNVIMLVFGAFTIVLATVPLTLMWSQKRRRAVAVQRMLGFSTSFTLWRMFGRLMILFHLGFLLSYGVYFIIVKFGYLNLKSFFSLEMAVAYLGALVFNILIAIVPFVQTMRVEPGDALRRE